MRRRQKNIMTRKRYNYPKLIFAIIVTALLVFGLPYAVIHSSSREITFEDKNVKLTDEAKREFVDLFEQFSDPVLEETFEEDFKIQDDYIKEYTVKFKSGFDDPKTFSLYLPYNEDELIVKSQDTGRGILLRKDENFNKKAIYIDTPEFFKQYENVGNNIEFEFKTKNGSASIEQGELGYVLAKNIKYPSYLEINYDGNSLVFYSLNDGTEDSYVAMIPSTYSTEAGEKKIISSYYSEIAPCEQEIKFQVNPREFNEENLVISKDTVKEKRTEDARSEIENKMNLVFSKDIYEYEGGMEDFFADFTLPVSGVLTTEYGVTRYVNNELSPYTHSGLDIACPEGTSIKATAKGQVVFADELTLTGKTVVINHGFGIFSIYYHQSMINCEEGDIVNQGDVIGKVGTTGFSTGAHLHFEITYKDQRLEPGRFIYGEPVTYQNYNELF